MSDAAWKHAQCYLSEKYRSGGDIEGTIKICKGRLLDLLGKIEPARALLDYFKTAYPTAGDALAGLGGNPCGPCGSDSGRLQNISYGYPQHSATSDGASESNYDKMSNWIVNWVSKRTTYKPGGQRLIIDLAVNSHDKDKAILTLFYFGTTDVTGRVGDVTTQNSLHGIARGKYRYELKRSGYKTYDTKDLKPEGFLNLVDWDWTEKGLSCTLVREHSKEDALPCSLQ